jgi:RNA polymerase sigma-70 factor (ECF subfamily)
MSGDFRSLADKYGARVYTFALYTLRRREDAEDVTQEVLVRLWQNREAISSEGMTAWVMRVTRNLVIDVARRHRARAAVMAEGADAQMAASFVASHHRADVDTQRGELRDVLETAVAGLEEPYRSIVVMREIQGFAYEEVAEALELPLGTVKAYLHRARRRLRDSVRSTMGDSGYDLS